MYFDLEDYHPEEPRVGRAISAREGVLLSLIAHLIALVLILLAPRLGLFKSTPIPMQPPDPNQIVRFVSIETPPTRLAPPINKPVPSDMDRRSATVEKPPQPVDPTPASRGNTSERSVPTPPPDPGRNGDPNPPAPPTPPQPPNATAIPDTVTPARTAGSGLASSLKNLSKYINNQSFDNPKGGQTDTGADIQFDSKGIDFGPWLARFRAQVMSNWLIPQAAFVQHGHVVFQFWVARDGTISDVHIVDPSKVDVFNTAAHAALTRSNPTVPLPKEYPTDKILFTVTFYYNEEVHH
jgi:TonB family protein